MGGGRDPLCYWAPTPGRPFPVSGPFSPRNFVPGMDPDATWPRCERMVRARSMEGVSFGQREITPCGEPDESSAIWWSWAPNQQNHHCEQRPANEACELSAMSPWTGGKCGCWLPGGVPSATDPLRNDSYVLLRAATKPGVLLRVPAHGAAPGGIQWQLFFTALPASQCITAPWNRARPLALEPAPFKSTGKFQGLVHQGFFS